jgi:hypothetical protein
MSLQPATRQGGTKSWQKGSLKRRLPAIRFANLVPGASGDTTVTSTMKLTGLSGALNVQIAAGFVTGDGNLIKPVLIMPAGVTMQLTPVNNFGDAGRMMLRPVFQDPALPVNSNNPLPMDLPFGWEFSTECDEVWIDLVINRNWTNFPLASPPLVGTAVVEVTIEYQGQWQDVEAIEFMIGQVNLTDCTPVIIATAGGT